LQYGSSSSSSTALQYGSSSSSSTALQYGSSSSSSTALQYGSSSSSSTALQYGSSSSSIALEAAKFHLFFNSAFIYFLPFFIPIPERRSYLGLLQLSVFETIQQLQLFL
jgi:hypothetical protein